MQLSSTFAAIEATDVSARLFAVVQTKSAAASAQVVRMPGLQARPLSGGTSIDTEILLTFKPLRPACRRVLPHFLAPVNGQVEQPTAVIHRLDAANCGPVGLEDIGSLPQVANDVHHARPAPPNPEPSTRASPAHEVAIPGALFVRALAEHGEGDVARMNIGQLVNLRRNPGAPLALLRRRVAGVSHEVVGDEHPASLKRVQ